MSINFYFQKVTQEKDEHKENIEFLNTKLSNKGISEVSLIDTESEVLISTNIIP